MNIVSSVSDAMLSDDAKEAVADMVAHIFTDNWHDRLMATNISNMIVAIVSQNFYMRDLEDKKADE